MRLNSGNNITCWQKDGGWYIGDHFSSGITCMQYWNRDYDPVDSWLVMREIAIPDDHTHRYTLRWHIQCNHSKYQVMVSTHGRSSHSLFDTLHYEQNDSTHWSSRTLTLDAYRGQNIYIALRNLGWYNSPTHYSDIGVIRIDTIQVLVSSDTQTYRTLTLHVNNPTMGTLSGSGTYPDSSTVTISATANDGHHFTQWDDHSTNAVRSILLVSDTSFTAYFAVDSTHTPPTPDTVWRSVTVSANVNGAPAPYGSGLHADSSTVEIGYHLADTAAPGGHWQFLRWSDGPTASPRTILVTSDTAIVAQFQWIADTTEGIFQVESGKWKIQIHPNPTHGDVTIAVTNPLTHSHINAFTVSVIDLMGRTVIPPTAINSSLLIPHSTLPPGTFFVRVTSTTGTAVRKLIVE